MAEYQEEIDKTTKWICKWGTKKVEIQLPDDSTFYELQLFIEEKTSVPMDKQKILKLKSKTGVLDFETSATDLQPERGKRKRFTMVGTSVKLKTREEFSFLGQLVDDTEWNYEPDWNVLTETRAKFEKDLGEILKKCEINIINQPRKGKKLLVLDLDYTLYDMKGMRKVHNQMLLKRPFTDEFMTALYPHYDFVVWSQTSWRALEMKLTELGMLQHPSYCISFVLDKPVMPYIKSMTSRGMRKHQIKPLELIWRKFPEFYGPHNTVHIDDLALNFVMNPQQCLKIKPYKNYKKNVKRDRELQGLTKYFLQIKDLKSFEHLDHNKWKNYKPE